MEKIEELSLDMLGKIGGGTIEENEYPIIDYFIRSCKECGETLQQALYTVESQEIRDYLQKNWDKK